MVGCRSTVRVPESLRVLRRHVRQSRCVSVHDQEYVACGQPGVRCSLDVDGREVAEIAGAATGATFNQAKGRRSCIDPRYLACILVWLNQTCVCNSQCMAAEGE